MLPASNAWLCRACQHSIVARSAARPLRLAGRSQSRAYTSTTVGARNDRPFRMAVVGSGPAGFYTAYRVMSKVQGAKVDMFEALPVPYGLVRFGVAPDHPEVKNCQEKFEEVASSPDFTFVGNVTVGGSHPGAADGSGSSSGSPPETAASAPLDSLLRHYDAVVFAYGASRDRQLGIPGESAQGVLSAREFVGWYNGLPEFADLDPGPLLARADEAVVVGQGNVALDVARMLLESVDVLRRTDMTEAAAAALAGSSVRRVRIVGRRGPAQAAFTIKELRELIRLPGVAFHLPDPAHMPPDPAALAALPRPRRRLLELMLKGSAAAADDPASAPPARSWSLDYCLSPTAFQCDEAGSLRGATFERTVLTDPLDPDSSTRPLHGAPAVDLPAQVAFRSIGYKSAALPGFAEARVAFSEARGVIAHDGAGRVLRREEEGAADCTGPGPDDQPRSLLPGVYCAGWVKRGPTGVIASTMEDAFATADAVAADWAGGADFLPAPSSPSSSPAAGWDGVRAELGPAEAARARVISWGDWRRIDAAERRRGLLLGKEREKFTRTADMIAAARRQGAEAEEEAAAAVGV